MTIYSSAASEIQSLLLLYFFDTETKGIRVVAETPDDPVRGLEASAPRRETYPLPRLRKLCIFVGVGSRGLGL